MLGTDVYSLLADVKSIEAGLHGAENFPIKIQMPDGTLYLAEGATVTKVNNVTTGYTIKVSKLHAN